MLQQTAPTSNHEHTHSNESNATISRAVGNLPKRPNGEVRLRVLFCIRYLCLLFSLIVLDRQTFWSLDEEKTLTHVAEEDPSAIIMHPRLVVKL